MTKDEVFEKVRAIIVTQLDIEPEEIGLESDIRELIKGKHEALPELQLTDLTFDLEEEFNLKFSDEEVVRIRTVADIVDIIVTHS